MAKTYLSLLSLSSPPPFTRFCSVKTTKLESRITKLLPQETVKLEIKAKYKPQSTAEWAL
jgi:hypothetical protein